MEITLDNVESSAEVVKEVFKMSRAGITGHQVAETSLIRGRKSMRAALYFYELRQLYYVLYA